jgi:hypothetical protein
MMWKAIIFVLLPLFIFSQETKFPIEVKHTGDDPVGSLLVYDVKQRFKESNTFEYDYLSENRWVLEIITLDPDENLDKLRGSMTIFSFILYAKTGRFFVHHVMSGCGRDRVKYGSIMIYDSVEGEIEGIMKRTYERYK